MFREGDEKCDVDAREWIRPSKEQWYIPYHRVPSPCCTAQRAIRDESGVPTDGAEMVGREEEVGTISSLIESGRHVVMITGLPGIGKTTVAATVADELLRSQILQNIRYLNLSNVTELSDAVSRIGAALKHPIYQSALSSGKSVLLRLIPYSFLQADGRGSIEKTG